MSSCALEWVRDCVDVKVEKKRRPAVLLTVKGWLRCRDDGRGYHRWSRARVVGPVSFPGGCALWPTGEEDMWPK
jgi:hypothetical protein